jgi:hypothetical protein
MQIGMCQQISLKLPNIIKINAAVIDLLHVDRQTDRQTDRHGKLIGAFLQLFVVNDPKKNEREEWFLMHVFVHIQSTKSHLCVCVVHTINVSKN